MYNCVVNSSGKFRALVHLLCTIVVEGAVGILYLLCTFLGGPLLTKYIYVPCTIAVEGEGTFENMCL